jgi:hypothetical protein
MTVNEAWLRLPGGTIVRCQVGEFVKLEPGLDGCVDLYTGEIVHIENYLTLNEPYTNQFQVISLTYKPEPIRHWGRDPIVAEWDEGFFLRDDEEEDEGYSLFRITKDGPRREHVWIGSYYYAMYNSERVIADLCQNS